MAVSESPGQSFNNAKFEKQLAKTAAEKTDDNHGGH